MHYCFWILSFSIICHAATPPPKVTVPTPSGPLHFTVHIHNAQEARSNNSTVVANTQSNFRQDAQSAHGLAQLLPDEIKNRIQAIMASNQNFFSHYKWYLLTGTVLASYLALSYFIMAGNSYLGNNELWSSWHQELPLDQLLGISQEQLCQELLQEIHRRYTSSSSISSMLAPLTLFLSAIEKEEEQLKWYQSFYSWISYLKITKILPFNKIRFAKVTERLQRIAYFKNIFNSWIANYHYQKDLQSSAHEDENIDAILALADSYTKKNFLNQSSLLPKAGLE